MVGIGLEMMLMKTKIEPKLEIWENDPFSRFAQLSVIEVYPDKQKEYFVWESEDKFKCNCNDFKLNSICKHIEAVEKNFGKYLRMNLIWRCFNRLFRSYQILDLRHNRDGWTEIKFWSKYIFGYTSAKYKDGLIIIQCSEEKMKELEEEIIRAGYVPSLSDICGKRTIAIDLWGECVGENQIIEDWVRLFNNCRKAKRDGKKRGEIERFYVKEWHVGHRMRDDLNE